MTILISLIISLVVLAVIANANIHWPSGEPGTELYPWYYIVWRAFWLGLSLVFVYIAYLLIMIGKLNRRDADDWLDWAL